MRERFGGGALRVLADEPSRLAEIRGISPGRASEMSDAFLRLSSMRLLVEFLAEHDLPVFYAAGLFKLWGPGALQKLQVNPYILCAEQFGLAFGRADQLAEDLGFDALSPVRLDAALLYELRFNMQNGHAFIPQDKLVPITAQLCGQDTAGELSERLEMLCDRGDIVAEQLGDRVACYLHPVYKCECFLADEVQRLCNMAVLAPHDLEKRITRQEKAHDIRYADGQKKAMRLCFQRLISLISDLGRSHL